MRHTKFISLFFIAYFYSNTANAIAWGTGLTVGALINQAESSINSVVNSALDRFDMTVLNTRTQADGLVASARSDLEAVLNLTEDKLQGQNREIWRTYKNLLTDTESSLSGAVEAGTLASFEIGQVLANLTPWSEEPLVISIFTETPIFWGEPGKRVLHLRGMNLDHVDNSITVGSKTYQPSSRTPNKLTYEIDIPSLEKSMKLLSIGGIVYQDRTFWFDKEISKKWALPIFENNFGSIAVKYTIDTYPIAKRKTSNKDSVCQNSSSPFSTGKCNTGRKGTATASRGYSIVVDTIKEYEVSFSNSCSGSTQSFHIHNPNPNSFGWSYGAKASTGAGRRCRARVNWLWEEKPDSPVKKEMLTDIQPIKISQKGVTFDVPLESTVVALQLIRNEKQHSVSIVDEIYGIRTIHEPGTPVVQVLVNAD